MQIMVEGLALAAFGMMHQITTEPLLKKLLRYVMSDEARHVAFGVLSLQEFYKGLSDAELRERQEFAFDVARRLQRRFAHTEMWERMGVDPDAVYRTMDQREPARAAGVPAAAVLEDRPELQEARSARRVRRLAARSDSPRSASSSSRTGSIPARSTPSSTRSRRTGSPRCEQPRTSVAAIGAALAVFAAACTSTSARARSPPPPASTSTTVATHPSTSTTARVPGWVPPRVVKALRIVPSRHLQVWRCRRALAVDRAIRRQTPKSCRVPAEGAGRHPVVVYLHGSTGLAETELAWAQRLATRGFIVVAGCYLNPDPAAFRPSTHFWIPCPELPDVEHNTATATGNAYHTLVDVATALPDAKPGALGVVGVSLGAIVALTSTAEPR